MNGVALHQAGCVRLCHGVQKDSVVLVSCGSGDGMVKVSNGETLACDKSVKNKDGAVFACAHSPRDPLVVTGDEKGLVKVVFDGEATQEGMLTRLQLTPYCLAFSPNGSILAVAGDADGIKLIEFPSRKVYRQLRPCSGARGMAFDPKGTYLLIVSNLGNLQIWNVEDSQCIEKKTGIVRKVSGNGTLRCAWFPGSGKCFCVPGPANEICFYKRDTWELSTDITLPLQHTQPINALAFSPNGVYLASGGEDQCVCVFHLPSSELIVKKKLEAVVTDLEWHPTLSQLVIATGSGIVYSVPWDALCSDADCLDDPIADCSSSLCASDIESCDASDALESVKGHKRLRCEVKVQLPAFTRPVAREVHSVVHPGSTERCQYNKPFFFCWNYAGQIVVQSSEQNNSIQIIPKGFKVAPFLDFSGFTMGCLGLHGAFFAAPGKGDGLHGWRNAKLHYKSFQSWSQKTTWDMELLKEEQPLCVAVGDGFCAVCTSRNLLRLFTNSGLAIHMFTIPKNIVCLTARGSSLAMFFQGGENEICFQMYDVPKQALVREGSTQFTKLKWAGFSSEGMLCIMDSALQMKMFTAAFGGQWVPVLDGSALVTAPTDDLFVIEMGPSKLTAVEHKKHTPPQVQPPSVLEDFEFDLPVLPDAGQKSEFVMNQLLCSTSSIHHPELESKTNAQTAPPVDGQNQKMLLTMFNEAVKNKEEEKALDIVKRMSHTGVIEGMLCIQVLCKDAFLGALKLANHNRLHLLAHKISNILEKM